jgi:hypothetical protein
MSDVPQRGPNLAAPVAGVPRHPRRVRRLAPLSLLFMSACTVTSVAPSPAASPSSAGSSAPATVGVEPSVSASGEPPASVCRSPAEHVYHPGRLLVLNPCMTVTGAVDRIKEERDGDYHVRLHLDAPYADLVNAENVAQQAGDLILEPVCIHAITQADAVSACVGFTNPMVIPTPGTHVVATGAYVLDTDHGWTELHPLWDIHPG